MLLREHRHEANSILTPHPPSPQSKEGNVWSQWNQECLGYLLRLISQFSVDGPSHGDTETNTTSRGRRPVNKKSHFLVISNIAQSVIDTLDVQAVIKILMQISYDAAMPMDSNQLYCGTWGRGEGDLTSSFVFIFLLL